MKKDMLTSPGMRYMHQRGRYSLSSSFWITGSVHWISPAKEGRTEGRKWLAVETQTAKPNPRKFDQFEILV